MTKRCAAVERKTAETDIRLTLCLDGTGQYEIDTGCGFFDHMLAALARHGRFDLTVRCVGDTHVDDHHTVEDVGIVLGTAFARALGEGRGIARYGWAALPMDEALVLASVDLCGRGTLGWALELPTEKIGAFDAELVRECFLAFTRTAACALHVRGLAGENSHHLAECAFKAFARALRAAAAIDPAAAGEIPSTKGTLL